MQPYPVAMTDKPSYHHGNLREALISAAFDLLDREGVDAVTIRAVARAIGVAHSAPANHFKTRKDLLTALATRTFEQLIAAIQEGLDQGAGERREKLKVFADAVIVFGLTHPNRYRLLWRKDCLTSEDPHLLAQMDLLYEPLIELFEEGNQTAHRSSETSGIALWSLVHGYVSLRLDGNLVPLKDEVSGEPRERAIVDALFDGIAPS